MFFEAPKRPAITISRISPSTRLHKTARPTTLVALVLTRWSSAIGLFCRALGNKKALVDKRSRNQNQRHANESADPVKLVQVAQVVEE